MKFLGPTPHPRLNEAVAVVFLLTGLFVFASLVTYHPFDPSWNTATGVTRAANLTGRVGAFVADFCLQILGLTAYGIPVLILLIGWRWIRSSPIDGAFGQEHWARSCSWLPPAPPSDSDPRGSRLPTPFRPAASSDR